MDITTIPTQELAMDLLESEKDISICRLALSLGITSYSGGKVEERLDSNKRIVEVIRQELKRRRALPTEKER